MNAPRTNSTKTRRFKPYPQYKESGVEWLGKIPGHWEVYSLRRRLTMRVNAPNRLVPGTLFRGREKTHYGRHRRPDFDTLG